MDNQTVSLLQTLKAGAISGFIGMGLNHGWSIVAQQLGSVAPEGFTMAVTISSVFPILIAAVVYYLMIKFLKKGKSVFVVLGSLFLLFSLYGPLQPIMPDGSPTPEGFALLTIPMHFISGITAIAGIIRWSK
ncbi:MAG: hypothetical protein O9340_11480 [Cyclobacteriaceae bacterium]|nr:hypothetical protein [Cyclobacteriaceae bacterium]